MKLISHRGNLEGPDLDKENNPKSIDRCIEEGFDVEIDIRYNISNKKFYLGHDNPQYEVNWDWLFERIDNLWIHCKNIESLYQFVINQNQYNYFWHQNDDFTLTSKNYIWTYPGKNYTPISVIVMPEWNTDIDSLGSLKNLKCHGICSDYVVVL